MKNIITTDSYSAKPTVRQKRVFQVKWRAPAEQYQCFVADMCGPNRYKGHTMELEIEPASITEGSFTFQVKIYSDEYLYFRGTMSAWLQEHGYTGHITD